jgi:hypothetical protein
MHFGTFNSDPPRRPRRGLHFDAPSGEYFNLEHINYRMYQEETPAEPDPEGPYLTLVISDWREAEQVTARPMPVIAGRLPIPRG